MWGLEWKIKELQLDNFKLREALTTIRVTTQCDDTFHIAKEALDASRLRKLS